VVGLPAFVLCSTRAVDEPGRFGQGQPHSCLPTILTVGHFVSALYACEHGARRLHKAICCTEQGS
jgi:hypothetical protein